MSALPPEAPLQFDGAALLLAAGATAAAYRFLMWEGRPSALADNTALYGLLGLCIFALYVASLVLLVRWWRADVERTRALRITVAVGVAFLLASPTPFMIGGLAGLVLLTLPGC